MIKQHQLVYVCVLKHEAIQSFPSEQFYDGQLRTGHSEQSQPSTLAFWPRGTDQPIMFINVVGVEKSLTVTTAEGSEQSKSNDKEASLAVSCRSQISSITVDNIYLTAAAAAAAAVDGIRIELSQSTSFRAARCIDCINHAVFKIFGLDSSDCIQAIRHSVNLPRLELLTVSRRVKFINRLVNYTCLKKVLTFKLSVTLSNLNRLSKF